MKVLVTGSSGFVGSHAVEELSKRHEVVGVDKVYSRELPIIRVDREGNLCTNVTYYTEDLLNGEILDVIFKRQIPDVVLHLAAQARVEPSFEDPIHTYRTNVQATINLLEASLRWRVKRFIYASSEIIYGQADRYPTKEFYHYRPDSPYAASKVAGDVLVQNCHGLNTVVLRSGMGYGPRSPPSQVVTKFFLKAMNNEPIIFPEGQVRHPTRDINYILNFVRGVDKLLDYPELTGVYNLGSGEEVDMLTLAEKVISIIGPIGQLIEFSSRFKYRPGEEGKRTWLDNSKAMKDFNYYPEIKLDAGLNLTYEWLKNHRDYWS